MRLIDADALKREFHSEWDGVLVWDESGETTTDEFCNIVDAAPTIEADIKCEDCKTIIALKAALEADQLSAVDRAFEHIPPEYRRGIWDAIVKRSRYPDTAGLKTWRRWRQRVLWWTAFFSGFIDHD